MVSLLLKGIKMLTPLIWSMGFVFLCTLSVLIYVNRKLGAKKSRKFITYFPFILVLGSVLAIITSGLLYFFLKVDYSSRIQFTYEGFCWLIFIGIFFCLFKYFRNSNIKLKLFANKLEILLFCGSIAFGVICLLFLFINNPYYILPYDKYGEIGDFYFNADVGRGLSSAIGFQMPHKIHPGYRFLFFPITAPITVINKLILNYVDDFGYIIKVINGYYLCLIQIVFNAVSSVIFYRVLRNGKLNTVVAAFGTILLIVAFSSVWLSILPETYSISLLFLLITIYMFQKKSNILFITAIFAFALNPLVIVPTFPLLIIQMFKYKDYIVKAIKKYRSSFIITSLIALGGIGLFFILAVPYLFRWSDLNSDILEKIKLSLPYIATPWLIGAPFDNIDPYFVQTTTLSIIQSIFILLALSICIIGLIKSKDKAIGISAGLTLFAGYILHVFMGYGRYNGIVYAPLYTWATIILLSYGIVYLSRNIKRNMVVIYVPFIAFIVIQNVLWTFDIGNTLSTIQFSDKIEENERIPSKIYLYNKDSIPIKFVFINRGLYRYLDQKKILNKIDSYRFSMKNRGISGLLDNSSWFKLFSHNGRIYINNAGKLTELKQPADLYKQFFIFGMGLRKKYIFTKTEQGYNFIRYSDEKVLLQSVNCNNIDAENYLVTGSLQQGAPFIIFENESGIYMNIDGKETVLDDTVRINIPSFENHKYKKQLKILFNEIMVNITRNGPTPNFIAYPDPWYRDAAIMAMVLKETDNISQITNWISSIDKIYDEQSGLKEPDNLGQLLYLISLTDNRNINMINNVLSEANKLKGEKNYLSGITDGTQHPVYQTRWLIFGMKELGLDYSNYSVPMVEDSYASLMWFDEMGIVGCHQPELTDNSDRWPYLYFARLHFNKDNVKFIDNHYPISYELAPEMAKFDNLRVLNSAFVENKLVVPHGWAAAEMFLYLLDSKY